MERREKSLQRVFILITLVTLTVFVLTACGKKETKEPAKSDATFTATADTKSETTVKNEPIEKENTQSEPIAIENTKNEPIATEDAQNEPVVTENTQNESIGTGSDSEEDNLIKKVQGAADESGIYTLIVTLSDKIADKGTMEYIYYGTKGSAHEDVVVCTFTANYYKEEAGTYDIMTYYDGQINTHLTHKKEVKVDNTFGAMVRAGEVVVYYTPEGSETEEIYRATADDFR